MIKSGNALQTVRLAKIAKKSVITLCEILEWMEVNFSYDIVNNAKTLSY